MTGSGGGESVAKMLQVAKQIAAALESGVAPLIYKTHRIYPETLRDGAEQFERINKQFAPELDKSAPARSRVRGAAVAPPSGASARGTDHLPDPTADENFLDLPIEVQIRRLEEAHGIRTDAQRALELSLFMEDKFRDIALISRQARPETIFDGPEGWASWLDARLFARRNLHREMSVDLLQEFHRRLRIRHDPETAGRMQGARRSAFGTLSRPLSRSARAAIEENPLLTYAPGPFRTEPYGVVFHPSVEGRLGAREMRPLDAPPTAEELATFRDDPLQAYIGPDFAIRGGMSEGGVIIYPNFGSVEGTRVFHQSLCDDYNAAREQSGYRPYQAAAHFQRQLISGHSWEGPFHGRHSRVALNFLLEQAGKPPSAIADFNDDLYVSSSQWVEKVEEGSSRYQRWQNKLEQAGGDMDPVDLFDDLRPMMRQYQEMGGESSPFEPGQWHDSGKYEQLHGQLRSGS
ncbi:hypothetical protein [Nocardia sienata]|uniref:hypothetical protein n=1 Tax=Nocardia sienata TaxID=248552 RepID=UPI0007A39454|nr:hypothetical protein [Nocardia sienata]